jgi:hypothetical protein
MSQFPPDAEQRGPRHAPADQVGAPYGETMDDLDRMFRRLVQNIRTGYPDYLSRPFEVSELYQNIIPYRHNRSELGLEQNQDY